MGASRRGGGGGGRPGERARAAPAVDAEAERLLHELEVHRTELELQNEELRATRAEVEAALRRYSELFEVAPVGYLVVEGGGRVREVNATAARLLGLARGRIVGRRAHGFVASVDRELLDRLLADVLVDGRRDAACEVTLFRHPAGTLRARLRAAPLAGQPDAVLVAADDVTARHEALTALREESRRKDDFLAALSHELRNPLAPIRNGLRLLAGAPAGSDRAARALAVLERQVAHLGRIVDDLLDVTRISRGKIRLHREPAELGALVQRTVEDHRVTFDAAGVELEVRPPREACWVLVDATRVVQVLGNLLGNAAKFTADGGRVIVTVSREAEAAAVTIRDTGVGIAPEIRDRLFQPFTQAPQTIARTRGGLGLGLATVKGLVELHGGTVDLSSAGPGRGAEFTVRLPLAAAPPDRPAAPHAPCPRGRRVLVIDDNEDGATTLGEVLALSGHEARVALDGPSGLALAHDFHPDVVVCDIGLPGMDGYAVARALRADPATHDAFLVALTGYALPDDRRRAAEAGFDRHLAKPLVLEAFERALAEPRAAAAPPGMDQPPAGVT